MNFAVHKRRINKRHLTISVEITSFRKHIVSINEIHGGFKSFPYALALIKDFSVVRGI